MTVHIQFAINLWWLVYYLATGVALFFPSAVALAWCMPGTVRENMSDRFRLGWWLTRPPVGALIWPLMVYVAVNEVLGVRKARRHMLVMAERRKAHYAEVERIASEEVTGLE